MTEFFTGLFSFLGDNLAGRIFQAFFISMLPVVELRAGLPYGITALGLHPLLALLVCFLGNILPVPFIVVFIRQIFRWMRSHSKTLSRLVTKLEDKGNRNAGKVHKYKLLGLFILVAIPLPGTGAWTGSLVAALLKMRLKDAFPAIALGVLASGLIMLFLTLGITAIFNM